MRDDRCRRLSLRHPRPLLYWDAKSPVESCGIRGGDGSPLGGQKSAEQRLRDVDESGGSRDPCVGGSATAETAGDLAEKAAHAWLRGGGTGIRCGGFLMNAKKNGELMGQRRRKHISEMGQQRAYHGRDRRRGLSRLVADFLDKFVQHGCVPPALGYDGDRCCRPRHLKSRHEAREIWA
jgi:hypothetical protein